MNKINQTQLSSRRSLRGPKLHRWQRSWKWVWEFKGWSNQTLEMQLEIRAVSPKDSWRGTRVLTKSKDAEKFQSLNYFLKITKASSANQARAHWTKVWLQNQEIRDLSKDTLPMKLRVENGWKSEKIWGEQPHLKATESLSESKGLLETTDLNLLCPSSNLKRNPYQNISFICWKGRKTGSRYTSWRQKKKEARPMTSRRSSTSEESATTTNETSSTISTSRTVPEGYRHKNHR